MNTYAVRQVARMAGVSVRTLHLYDQLGLLKPLARTAAGYRTYGEKELLRLQQILFYKEMDVPLEQIRQILDDPHFDLLEALHQHKAVLKARNKKLQVILKTIDKTINYLKHQTMLNHEELYEGFGAEAEAIRAEAIEKYGREKIELSEKALSGMSKADFKALQDEQKHINEALFVLRNEDPASPAVQFEITRHYHNIRRFWGTHNTADKQAAAYAGLGELYMNDARFTRLNGQPQPEFALFLRKAMKHFAENLS